MSTAIETLAQQLSAECHKDAEALSNDDKVVALDRISKLHTKYSDLCSKHVFSAIKANAEFKRMRLLRFRYFRGDLNADPETLKEQGWVPLQKKIDTSQIKEYIDGDDKLTELKCTVEQYEELAERCRRMMETLKGKNFAIQATLKFQMFLHDGSE